MNNLNKYQKILDDLPLVVRAIILAAVLSIIFIIWYYGFWRDLHQSKMKKSNVVAALKSSLDLLETQLKNLETKAKLSLEQPSKSIMPSAKTKTLLDDLLTTNNDFIVLQLTNIPPKEKETAPGAPPNIQIFENNIVIKFMGDYFSTMNYLQTIEKLPWKIFWDKLEYKVTQYPAAEITLHIHTLSHTLPS